MQERASGSTDSLMRVEVDPRTTEVRQSDRQSKRSKTDVSDLANELMHLGAVGLRLCGWYTNRKIGNRWKSHGGQSIQSILMSQK